MMTGGVFMMGVGILFMLLVISMPIVLVAVLIGAMTNRRDNSAVLMPTPITLRSASARYCSHCGTALKADWTHCPQCGAPV